MSERRFGSQVRQEFEAQIGVWKTRIVDFPDRYLRSRAGFMCSKFKPTISVFEVKQTGGALSILTETIHSNVDSLDQLEAFLHENYIDVASPSNETTPSKFEHYFHTPLAMSYNGQVQIKMIKAEPLNEKLTRMEEIFAVAQVEDVRRYGGHAIIPQGLKNYYQRRNYRLALPSSLRVKSLITQALESS